MPFGQMGLIDTGSAGGSAGGGWSWPTLPDPWDLVQTGLGVLGGWLAPGAAPPSLPQAPTAPQAPPITQNGGLGVLQEHFPGLFGGGAAAANGGLFKPPMASMKPRPVNKIQVMGPDGKCHTWLHATPKGWKVNASNVSGRRRRHSHPR